MRKLLSIAAGVAAGTLICLPAMAAATVKVMEGQVSINQGQGYKQVAGTARVATGDRVMAAQASKGNYYILYGSVLQHRRNRRKAASGLRLPEAFIYSKTRTAGMGE